MTSVAQSTKRYKLGISVVGLGFCNEGKGGIVDFLAKKYNCSLIIRTSGGCHEKHHVVTPDGKEYGFSHLSSGTFAGATTCLGPSFAIDPPSLLDEVADVEQMGVKNILENFFVYQDCPVVTPFNKLTEKLETLCANAPNLIGRGAGVNHLKNDQYCSIPTLRAADLGRSRSWVQQKLIDIQSYAQEKADHYKPLPENAEKFKNERLNFHKINTESWADFYRDFYGAVRIVDNLSFFTDVTNVIIYENGQGILTDQDYGWGKARSSFMTTGRKALDIHNSFRRHVPGSGLAKFFNLGVMRSYVFGQNSFPTESDSLTSQLKENNKFEPRLKGKCGHFDIFLHNRAIGADVHGLAVTHLDKYVPKTVYSRIETCLNPDSKEALKEIEVSNKKGFFDLLTKKVIIESYGVSRAEKTMTASLST